ncbi:hypothetical protein R6Q59_010033 [Mikania micrantha]
MCKNLVEKGNLSKPLLIHNRTVSRAEKLCSEIGHSTVISSVPELVSKSDITFLCLGDDDAVLNTIQTLVDELKDLRGKLIVDCSTIHPDSTRKENEMLKTTGAEFVACPVFGAPAMADAGQLVCVLAGPAGAVDKVKPFCKGVMGRAEIDFSDHEPSRATLMKLIGNSFILSMVNTLSEGHVLAEKSGLGTKELHQFIEVMFPGPYVAYSNRLMTGDYYKREEPLFAVDLARKDARHAKKLAADASCRMRNVELAEEYLEGVQKHMGNRGDIAGIYGAKRQEAGLQFEN